MAGSGVASKTAVSRLGIGLPYFASLPPELYQRGLIDFVEVTPETICRQRLISDVVELEIVPQQMETARNSCLDLPMVVHGVELSIGSAHGWNGAYLKMLDVFQKAWPFVWHSEHLGFQTFPGVDGRALEVGVPLPLPPTCEAADLVAERSETILQRYGVPFLLENPAYYLPDPPSDPEVGDDIGLMRRILRRSGSLQLLDLHNVYCNAINHRFDPFAAVDRMPLEDVGEIHIAGGSWDSGFWMDAHDGRVPEPVWDLLEYTLPLCPSVGGIVFEMLDEHVLRLGVDAIQRELTHARDIWMRRGRGEGYGTGRLSNFTCPVSTCH